MRDVAAYDNNWRTNQRCILCEVFLVEPVDQVLIRLREVIFARLDNGVAFEIETEAIVDCQHTFQLIRLLDRKQVSAYNVQLFKVVKNKLNDL